MSVVSLFDSTLFNFADPALHWALFVCCWGPFTWNIIARSQYRSNTLSNLFGGNKKLANYALAIYILVVGFYRDKQFANALASQPVIAEFTTPFFQQGVAAVCFLFGQLLVLSSAYQLGFIGTFLGDYFGFLSDSRVTAFPFNILSNPMYVGATLSFIGISFYHASAAGLLLSAWVWIIYIVALYFEEPFTGEIYAARERKRNRSK